jgi:hypothetical protein
MTFVDGNNLIELMRLRMKIADLSDKREYYIGEIAKAKAERQKLFSNDKTQLEIFAREKYYMKKENEDIFIFLKSPD